MTSEACVAIILALECSAEKAKKRCFYINDQHMLCNLTTHNANALRNSRVAQKISEQF
jgi:hypothetical protein